MARTLNRFALRGRIVTPHATVTGVLRVADGRIETIAESASGPVDRDFGDAFILPGFIDVHLHGIGDYGMTALDDLLGAAALQPRCGTTAFVPTLGSRTEGQYRDWLATIREAREQAEGAAIPGGHMEGPFIAPERKGGMDADYLRPVDVAECGRYIAAGGDALKIMSLSPELPGAVEIIRALRANGTVASMGHADPPPTQLAEAVEAGLGHVCHLFNAFRRPGHKREGRWETPLIAAILREPRLTCEVNCDCVHVSPENISAAVQALAPDRFVAITDSMQGAGKPPGTYAMADGRAFSTESGVGRLASDGTIVGSVITMDRAFAALVRRLGVGVATAARFCATNPARVLGMEGETGSIALGKRADLAVLDEGGACLATYVGGVLHHDA